MAVKAGRMLDVRSGEVLTNVVVIVEDGRIKAAGSGLAVPAGAKVVDLGNACLLPGLIDAHTHITMQMRNYYEDLFRSSPIDEAVVAHVNARRTLEAGFTSIRDVGAAEFIDVALRKAVDAGAIPGPRMQVATLAVGAELERVAFVMKGGAVFKR